MIQNLYFYREFSSSNFIQSESPKKMIFVRLKNHWNAENTFFDDAKKTWLPFETTSDICTGGALPVEFAENPVEPENPLFNDASFFAQDYRSAEHSALTIEDLDAGQMEKILAHRDRLRRYKFNRRNFLDSNGIEKDYAAVTITTDTENFTLKIIFHKFEREEKETNTPTFVEKSLFFDIKNGVVDLISDWEEFSEDACIKDGTYYDRFSFYPKSKPRKLSSEQIFDANIHVCEELETKALSKQVIRVAYEKLLELAEGFTRVSFAAWKNYSDPIYFPRGNMLLGNMYKITMLPFEPKLFEILSSDSIKSRYPLFKYKRNDSKIFKRFCKKAKVRNTKTVRKCYAERPRIIFTFLHLKDVGFKDMNLFNRVIESPENCSIINNCDATSLAFFCRWSIKKRGQKNTMNTVLKETDDSYNLIDGVKMFCKYFKHIPEQLKEDILKDGFTEFNHDALSKIAYQFENKNITFKHTKEEKSLEDEIDGYKFCLPENSYKLCDIGTSLHNCVASYAKHVQNKECTIIYATKDEEYKICIEVRGKEIRQERADHNSKPLDEERKILDKWHERHGLVV